MRVLGQCQASTLAPAAIMERKALLDVIMTFCKKFKVCPTCAASACLYAAALAAHKGLEISLEKYLEASKEIWTDVQNQTGRKIIT